MVPLHSDAPVSTLLCMSLGNSKEWEFSRPTSMLAAPKQNWVQATTNLGMVSHDMSTQEIFTGLYLISPPLDMNSGTHEVE